MKKKLDMKAAASAPAEPFDLKASMTPVTGNSLKVDLSGFPTVTSKDGHDFQVIGTLPSGLRVSFRTWKEASNQGETLLGFRVRVGDRESSPATAKDFDEITALSKSWTSTFNPGSAHRSILGQLFSPQAAWAPVDVYNSLLEAGHLVVLYEAISGSFPEGSTFIGLQKFLSLMYSQICVTLQDVAPPYTKKKPATVSWGPASALVIDLPAKAYAPDPNHLYTKEEMALKPAPTVHPQSFAAPHPKDKAASATKPAKTATKAAKAT